VVGQTTRSKGLWYSALAVIRWQSIPSKTRTFSNRYACSAGGTCSTDALTVRQVTFKSDFTQVPTTIAVCNRWIKFPCSKLGLPVKSPAWGGSTRLALQHALILLKANGSTAMLQYDLSQGEEHPPKRNTLQPDKIEPTAYWYRGSAGLIPDADRTWRSIGSNEPLRTNLLIVQEVAQRSRWARARQSR